MGNTRNCKINRGDFISSLPDELLLMILSKLNVKEQARTSILSSRWTDLWTFNTTCLNIDYMDFLPPCLSKILESFQRPVLKFTNIADHILRMQRGPFITQLKIIYPRSYGILRDRPVLDSWISTAKQRQVKALYLDLGLHRVQLSSLGSTSFSSLVAIFLKNASLSDEIIRGLLSNSPNLLELSIIHSLGGLEHLSISGSSLKLKHLELVDNRITFLEISAPNLVSFRCSPFLHRCMRTCFSNVPLLTQLCCPLDLMLKFWCDFYVLLPQLVALDLSEYSMVRDIPDFPVLINLLIGASPCLCRLSLQLGTDILLHNFIENFPGHEFLKELEIDDFRGLECEVKLLICMVESCPSLQKIIIRPGIKVEQDSVGGVVNNLAARLPQKELKIVFKARDGPNISRF